MKKVVYLSIFFLIVILGGCSTEKDYLISIETKYGTMKAVLFDETPLHKENFINLAKAGRYDSTIFHRVINKFMIQGGNIDAKEGSQPSDKKISAEFVKKYFHRKGAIAAARMGDQQNPEKASSWCQFYIVQGNTYTRDQLIVDQAKMSDGLRQLMSLEKYADLKQELIAIFESGDMEAYNQKLNSCRPLIEEEFNMKVTKDMAEERIKAYESVGGTPHLDDTYTVFGLVVEGLNIVDSVAIQPTGPGDKPVEDIIMKMKVEEISKKRITEAYGIEYPDN